MSSCLEVYGAPWRKVLWKFTDVGYVYSAPSSRKTWLRAEDTLRAARVWPRATASITCEGDWVCPRLHARLHLTSPTDGCQSHPQSVLSKEINVSLEVYSRVSKILMLGQPSQCGATRTLAPFCSMFQGVKELWVIDSYLLSNYSQPGTGLGDE